MLANANYQQFLSKFDPFFVCTLQMNIDEDIFPDVPHNAVEKLCQIMIDKNLADTEELRVVAKKQIITSVMFLEELGAKVRWKTKEEGESTH